MREGSAGYLGQHVRLAKHEELVPLDVDLGAAVFRVEDFVAIADVDRAAAAVLVVSALADGDDLLVLRESDILAKLG